MSLLSLLSPDRGGKGIDSSLYPIMSLPSLPLKKNDFYQTKEEILLWWLKRIMVCLDAKKIAKTDSLLFSLLFQGIFTWEVSS